MKLLSFFRKSFIAKVIAVIMAVNIFLGFTGNYNKIFALTGGPSQPEAQGFQPVGADNLVDLSTGDFSYNIPLFDVGGYPVNLAYNSDISMDQEASWVGLGWSLNTGVINRTLRGIPDDFNGDVIKKDYYTKPYIYGEYSGMIKAEIYGFDFGSVGLMLRKSIAYNNYNKILDQAIAFTPSITFGDKQSGLLSASLGLTMEKSMTETMTFSPDFSMKLGIGKDASLGSFNLGIGTTWNNINGIKSLNMRSSLNVDNSTKGYSGSIDYVTPSFLPNIEVGSVNECGSLSANIGGLELYGAAGFAGGSLTYSKKKYNEQANTPSFGFLYMDKNNIDDEALLDYNREKDGPYLEGVTNHLPLAYFTPDLYSVNAQGLSGSFKPYRSDVGYVFDNESMNMSYSMSESFELGSGSSLEAGVDLSNSSVTSTTGAWSYPSSIFNEASVNLGFQEEISGDLYEPYAFKQVGELAVSNESGVSLYEKYAGEEPMMVKLAQGAQTVAKEKFINKNNTNDILDFSNSPVRKSQRYTRNNNFRIISYKEAQARKYAFCRKNAPQVSKNQIAAIEVTKQDGNNYVFGYPVYNKKQEEVVFSVSTDNINDPSSDEVNGLIKYEPGKDNAKKNSNGTESFYSKTTTPIYAHSFMLSAVLSPEYIDVTGDGPTDDDLGAYTKFEYDVHKSNFKWRTPCFENMAAWNKGQEYNNLDDKGSYVYGEKEVVYLSVIESKTHYAEFFTSEREDAFGVKGENGGFDFNAQNPQSLLKLDKIEVYSKKIDGTKGKKIKTIHFEYYDSANGLCPGIPNSSVSGGKLTLKKVYFTYADSQKARYNFYKFSYKNDVNSSNVQYSFKGYDKWGNYKSNQFNPGQLSNIVYPYVQQSSTTDEYAGLWKLDQIDLPSGGTIKVEYESDRYAYIQDRRAMQMVRVSKMKYSSDEDDVDANMLYDVSKVKDEIYFNIPSNMQSTITEADSLIKYYLEGIDKLYYKYKVGLNSSNEEYISGYAKIQKLGGVPVCGVSGNEAWVRIESVDLKDDGTGEASPISKAGWRFILSHDKGLGFHSVKSPNQNFVDNFSPKALLPLLSGSVMQAISLFESLRNPFAVLKTNNICSKYDPSESFIRLREPTLNKYGGGARVKSIAILDNWDSMTGESAKSYKKNYIYTKKEQGYHPEGQSDISSGVASYEPLLGGDENPFRYISSAQQERVLSAPDIYHYVQEPFGENLFPSPRVVYSKVRVETDYSVNIPDRRGVGYSIHEFYTARDFPLRTDATDHNYVPIESDNLSKFFKKSYKKYVTASQGYAIITNDMHGKPKAVTNYDQNGIRVSGEKYDYQIGGSEGSGKLDNEITVIYPDGTWGEEIAGVDVEVCVDFRESETESYSQQRALNVNSFVIASIPIVVPTVIPGSNSSHTIFRSSSVTKHVHKRGILKAKTVFDLSSSTVTENVAFDSETGNVLLTKVKNDYQDEVYSFNYPAHWMYKGMGQAGATSGYYEEDLTSVLGNTYITQNVNYFLPGDKVLINQHGENLFITAHVLDVNYGANKISLIEEFSGKPVHTYMGTTWSNIDLRIINPGRTNMQAVSVGNVVMKENPLIIDGVDKVLKITDYSTGENINSVISASAIEYDSYAKMYCDDCEEIDCYCYYTNFYYTVTNLLSMVVQNEEIKVVNGGPSKIIDLFPAYSQSLTKPTLEKLFGITTQINSIEDIQVEISNNGGSQFDFTFTIDYNSTAQESVLFRLNLGQSTTEIADIVFPQGSAPGTAECQGRSNTDFAFPEVRLLDDGDFVIANCTLTTPSRSFVTIECRTDISRNFAAPVIINSTKEIVNPFHVGMLGRWYPKVEYAYLQGREYTQSFEPRHDGVYNLFHSFWQNPSLNTGIDDWEKGSQLKADGWTWTEKVSEINPHLVEIESINALGIFSSALFGFKTKMATAVSSNANYQQVASESFENRYYTVVPSFCQEQYHLNIDGTGVVNNGTAHTGNNSYLLDPDNYFSFISKYADISEDDTDIKSHLDIIDPNDALMLDVFYQDNSNCLKGFSFKASDNPATDGPEKYIVSFWLKDDSDGFKSIVDNQVHFLIDGTIYVYPESSHFGHIIDDWRKFTLIFSIPPKVVDKTVEFKIDNNSTSDLWYIDDFRIHPFNANMKSFVYDYNNWKLDAELDENNFATFYEYDMQGNLSRVKKETERGIVTLKEVRSQNVLKDNQ